MCVCLVFSLIPLRGENDFGHTLKGGIDLIRILTVGLEREYNGGSCGEYHLNLKKIPPRELLLHFSASPTVRIRISPILAPGCLQRFR